MSQTVTTADGAKHVFPDQATPQQMKTAIQRYVTVPGGAIDGQPASQGAGAPGTSPEAIKAVLGAQFPVMGGPLPVSIAPNQVSNILGGIGSMIPGPAGYGAAALGGGIGEANVQGVSAAMGQPFDAKQIAIEAGKQAVYKGAGDLLAAPLRAAGGILTGAARRAAAAATRKIYTAATNAGVKGYAGDLLQGLQMLKDKASQVGAKEAGYIDKLAENWWKTNGAKDTPLEIQAIKQTADGIARPIFDQAKSKFAPKPTTISNLRAQFYALIGDNSRQFLHQIPGAQAAESLTKREITANRFARGAAGRLIPAAAGAAVGGVLPGSPQQRLMHAGEGAAIGAGLGAVPTDLLGAALSNPALLQLLQQLPRGIGALAGQ